MEVVWIYAYGGSPVGLYLFYKITNLNSKLLPVLQNFSSFYRSCLEVRAYKKTDLYFCGLL